MGNVNDKATMLEAISFLQGSIQEFHDVLLYYIDKRIPFFFWF